MPLIVETGAGIANAESYVTVAEADAYHVAYGNTLWAAIDPIRKEQLLRKASQYLTNTYYGGWIGVAAFTVNLLAWPRKPTEARHYGLFELGVPLEIRQAVAELALIANTISLIPSPSNTRGKKRVKVGPIEVEYDSTSGAQSKFLAASMLLKPYLRPIASTNMATLIRA